MDISTMGIAGEDGYSPVYDENGLWHKWAIYEIWDGKTGKNRYVPKVNDYVIDPLTYEEWIVVHLDEVTLIPELKPIRPYGMNITLQENDVLFGTGPGGQPQTYLAYVDKSVTPYAMCIEQRLYVRGNLSRYARVFKGPVIDETKVISRLYDNTGQLLGDTIPLEVVAIDNHTNIAIKTVSEFNTVEDLDDDEIVTVVFYNDRGGMVSKAQLLVFNTGFVRSANISKRYISGIGLRSPFLSPTVPNVIEYPLNLPINALNIMGVVHYSDGSEVEMPINGVKFTLDGLDQYLSTIVSRRVPLSLRYTLGDDEVSYNTKGNNVHFITEPYWIETTNTNTSYTVKLYCYPVWKGEALGYGLKWWLLNLDRDICVDVTDAVRFAENTGPFDPKAYGVLQQKSVTINLRDVDSSFKSFIHTQYVSIILRTPPNGRQTPWLVSHETGADKIHYGDQLFVIKQLPQSPHTPNPIVKIDCGYSSFDVWYENVYLRTYPLVDRAVEVRAMRPTHFELIQGENRLKCIIDDWNQSIAIPWVVEDYSTMYIRFYKQTAAMELQLSMAAMLVTY